MKTNEDDAKVHERTIKVNGHSYRQRVKYVWDKKRGRNFVQVVEHLGPVSPIRKVHTSPVLGGIETILPAGQLALFASVAQEYSLPETLAKVCPSEGNIAANSLLSLIFNQINGRLPLQQIGPLMHASPLGKWIDAPDFEPDKNELLSSLDKVYSRDEPAIRRVNAIQELSSQAWRKLIGRDPAHHFLYSDVCRIVYNGNHCDWAEYGHGSEESGRPHIGIGIVTGRKHHFPLFSMAVKGSMHDSQTLGTVSAELKRRDMSGLTMVVDRAYPSEKSIKIVKEAGFEILGGCKEGSNEIKAAIGKWKDDEIERPGQIIPRSNGNPLYYRGWKGRLYGVKGLLVITLDPMRRMSERGDRDTMLNEVSEGKLRSSGWKRLREELGPVAVSSAGRRGWQIDWDKENEERRKDGRFLIFTTDLTLSPKDAIEAYFQRDEVEKTFRELKGSTSMAPIRYRLWNRVDAYLTVICHEAYLIRAGIKKRLMDAGRPESVDEAIQSLREVYMVKDSVGQRTIERWGPLTKEKKDLIKALKIDKFITTY